MSERPADPAPASAASGDLAVLLLDADGRVIAASPTAVRQLGRSGDQLRGRTLTEIFREGADMLFAWMRALANCHEPPPPKLVDLELLRSDGMHLAFEGVLYAVAVGPRSPGDCVAGLKLRPSGGLLAKSEQMMAQREVFALVAGGADLRATLGAVAAFAEHAMPGETFCMLSPVGVDGVFEAGLCPTLPDELAQLQAGRRAGEGTSPATVVAESGQRILAQDVDQVEPWRAFAARLHRHGLVASWALPIRSARSDRVRAVLEFLLPARRLPSKAELALLEELGEMVRLSLDLHGLASELAERAVAQRRAEDVAQQREARLDALVETALDAVISTADDGTITLWNRQAETLFGWSAAEVAGRRLAEFVVPPEMRKAHEAGLARAAQTGTGSLLGRRIEIQAIDRAGRRFPVELSISRMPGASGGFSAFLRDISERRRAEAAIKSSEERMKLVIDATADGVWDLRFDGGPSLVSDRCATMLGMEPMSAVACAPPDNPWIHPDDRPAIDRAWRDHVAGLTPRFESEHRRRCANGTLRWVLERAKVVERDGQGRVQRVVGIVSDVHQRRALEESLDAAERLESLGLLAGGFARELDELLSGIGAHAMLTKIAPGLPERVGEGLEVIQALVARAKSMARGLMGMAPTGAHEEALVQVAQSIREGLPLIRTAVPRTLEIELQDLATGLDLVRVDPAGLQQAMIHLVLRASEAMGHAGRVLLRVVPDGRMIRIECVDSAPPLSPQACAAIAEAFDARGALAGRAALGMAAARRFVESVGGSLRAEVRDGANVVALELPREPEAVPLVQPPVILCEDHPLLRPMLAEGITASGHRVIAIERGDGVPAFLRTEGPGTVVLLDALAWQDLGPQWPELCRALGWNPMTVLLLERDPGPLPQRVCWLPKPVSLETLVATIDGRSASPAAQP